jgi:hypothetical protein
MRYYKEFERSQNEKDGSTRIKTTTTNQQHETACNQLSFGSATELQREEEHEKGRRWRRKRQ